MGEHVCSRASDRRSRGQPRIACARRLSGYSHDVERRDRGQPARISVRLQPRAKRTEIVGERNGVVVVRVSAPAIEGRANRALCDLIAKRVGVSRRSVRIERGLSVRDKVVRVEHVTTAALRRALAAGAP